MVPLDSTNLAPRALQEEVFPDVMVESRFVKMSNFCPAWCSLALLPWDFSGNMCLPRVSLQEKRTQMHSAVDFSAKLSEVVASLPFRRWWRGAWLTHPKPQHSEGWGRTSKCEASMGYMIRPCLRRKGNENKLISSPSYMYFDNQQGPLLLVKSLWDPSGCCSQPRPSCLETGTPPASVILKILILYWADLY